MSKGKKIYFVILLLSVLIVYLFYSSYAIFTYKREEHGKLNIVAGTLNYKLESDNLVNNQIEVEAGDILKITLKLISLNSIDSKYELYYTLPDNVTNIEVGYGDDTRDESKGIIEANGEKEIKVVIKNKSESKVTITFGVHGGFSNLEFDNITGIGSELTENKIGDVILAWTYTGTKETPTAFPSQSDGYRVESVECNGIPAKFDNITWQLSIPKTTGTTTECNFILADTLTMDSSIKLVFGEAVAGIDGSKWHVLETSNSGVETVTLLSDYNLHSSTGEYNPICNEDYNMDGCSIYFDLDTTTTYDENDSNNIGYFIKNVYGPKVIAALPGTTNVTIPTVAQISDINKTEYDDTLNNIRISEWMLTSSYWTKTAYGHNTVNVWFISGKSGFGRNSARLNWRYGARPVITTPKTNLIAK